MAERTEISWTDATWNPIRGCSRVSEGCRHCYAEQVAARFSGPGQPYEGLAKKVGGEARWTGKVRFIDEHLNDPIRWKAGRRIFVNSMSDLFHEKLSFEQIDKVFAVMALAPQHTYQVLTKRPGRMLEYILSRGPRHSLDRYTCSLAEALSDNACARGKSWPLNIRWPLPNVQLGTSVENQDALEDRIGLLCQTPAAVRWLSCEPLLGRLDFSKVGGLGYLKAATSPAVPGIDWVVVGGESGPGYRPMEVDWLLSIVDQCRAADVPTWVKQDSGKTSGKQGRIPDGYWYVREFPQAVAV